MTMCSICESSRCHVMACPGRKAGLARALRSRAIQLAREGHTVEAAGLGQQTVPLAPGDPQLLRTLHELAPARATELAR
jgi:hypothetical protein